MRISQPFLTRIGATLVALTTFGAVACELDKIVVPEGNPIILVQSVMRPDRDQQWILVEQSLTGGIRNFTGPFIPGDSPDVPITGATVTVTNATMANDPCGTVVFLESAAPPDGASEGVYWSPTSCPSMRPGDELELRVEFEGEAVSGRTVIPGAQEMRLGASVAGQSVVIPGPALTFNRDVDTLVAEVVATGGRAVQLEVRPRVVAGFGGAQSSIATTTFWVDSTALTLPGDLVDIFEAEGDGEDTVPDLFVAGRHYVITVALTDQTYFDFLRSANFPLTGRGFINHLDGGFGVFGSVIAGENELRAVGVIDDPREGFYDVTGVVESVSLTMEWELYLSNTFSETESGDLFSSFAKGNWVAGPYDGSISGAFSGNNMEGFLNQAAAPDSTGAPLVRTWRIFGNLDPSGESTFNVADASFEGGGAVIGTLTARKRP